jgi:hypothetical protein
MNANLTNGLIGAGAGVLISGAVAVGYILLHPFSGPPYPNGNCNTVAQNTYTITFPSSTPTITATANFTWDTPGFHHNVNMAGTLFDIDQDPCTNPANGVLSFKLHPVSSNQFIPDPNHEDDWTWTPGASTVKVTRSDSGLVPVNTIGTVTTP